MPPAHRPAFPGSDDSCAVGNDPDLPFQRWKRRSALLPWLLPRKTASCPYFHSEPVSVKLSTKLVFADLPVKRFLVRVHTDVDVFLSVLLV